MLLWWCCPLVNDNISYNLQVALLSQRGRAMLRVVTYFAKSPKVIQNDTVE